MQIKSLSAKTPLSMEICVCVVRLEPQNGGTKRNLVNKKEHGVNNKQRAKVFNLKATLSCNNLLFKYLRLFFCNKVMAENANQN